MLAMVTEDKNGRTLYYLDGRQVSFYRYHVASMFRDKDTFLTIERKGKFYHYCSLRDKKPIEREA